MGSSYIHWHILYYYQYCRICLLAFQRSSPGDISEILVFFHLLCVERLGFIAHQQPAVTGQDAPSLTMEQGLALRTLLSTGDCPGKVTAYARQHLPFWGHVVTDRTHRLGVLCMIGLFFLTPS